MTFDDAARRYGTDKGPAFHGYTEHYQRIFDGRRIERLLEIGVAGGRSVLMWHELFPDALIVGVDINPWCRVHQREQVAVIIADAADPAMMSAVATLHGPFDVVIDDGEHDHDQVRMAFEELYPRVTPGGVYVIEDLSPDDPWVLDFAERWGGEIIPCVEGSLIVVERL